MKIYIRSSAYKRVARTDEFDNGSVMHGDWKKISDEEAEDVAKEKSLADPNKIYYVQYDDIMNPSSDIYWVNGISYISYNDALDAIKAK